MAKTRITATVLLVECGACGRLWRQGSDEAISVDVLGQCITCRAMEWQRLSAEDQRAIIGARESAREFALGSLRSLGKYKTGNYYAEGG